MSDMELHQPGVTRWWHLSSVGLLFGASYFLISWSPSLLSRTWYFQGLVSGLSSIAGYGLGTLVAWLLGKVVGLLHLRVTIRREAGELLRAAAYVFGAVVVVGLTVSYARSQARTAALVHLEPLRPIDWVGAILLALAIGAVLLGTARGLRRLTHRLALAVGKVLPRTIATLLSAVVMVTAIGWITDNVLFHRGLQALGAFAQQIDAKPPEGRSAPTSPTLSGSPASREPWETLGKQGQMFVTNGPTAAEISAATGEPAKEPIRVYAGGPQKRTLAQLSAAVVAELQRTGGFDRRVLVVVTTTGTGWVDDWTAQSIEYLADGDSAIAAMQYSNVWSALSLLTDTETARAGGKALFDAVYAEWERLPADHRPMLLVSGESLGAYGGHGAFRDVEDMMARAQGGVWVGTTSFTQIAADLTARRNPGSPEIVPVYDDGRHIRFTSRAEEVMHDYYGRPYGAWEFPRFVYAQHPSDPVVWWNPATLGSEPDWLREPRGRDVNPDVTWIPFVTFWQLASDMPLGHDPPNGFGHRYGPELVSYWGAVMGDEPGADYSRLIAGIEKTINPPK
jgi:uncharacterized membrane protein